MFQLNNAFRMRLCLGALLAFVALLMSATSEVQANAIAVINKSFVNINPFELEIVASGTFEFSSATSDIDGNVTFTKDVTLAASLDLDVQHVLIGDWETEWTLLKIGFQLDGFGGLIGFDPADVTFGPTGIFDVNITMVPPMPGHPSFFEFVAEEPITLMSIEDVLALIPAVPEFAALIAAIESGSGTGVVPVATTSLHVPEPSTTILLLLGLVGTSIVSFDRRRRADITRAAYIIVTRESLPPS